MQEHVIGARLALRRDLDHKLAGIRLLVKGTDCKRGVDLALHSLTVLYVREIVRVRVACQLDRRVRVRVVHRDCGSAVPDIILRRGLEVILRLVRVKLLQLVDGNHSVCARKTRFQWRIDRDAGRLGGDFGRLALERGSDIRLRCRQIFKHRLRVRAERFVRARGVFPAQFVLVRRCKIRNSSHAPVVIVAKIGTVAIERKLPADHIAALNLELGAAHIRHAVPGRKHPARHAVIIPLAEPAFLLNRVCRQRFCRFAAFLQNDLRNAVCGSGVRGNPTDTGQIEVALHRAGIGVLAICILEHRDRHNVCRQIVGGKGPGPGLALDQFVDLIQCVCSRLQVVALSECQPLHGNGDRKVIIFRQRDGGQQPHDHHQYEKQRQNSLPHVFPPVNSLFLYMKAAARRTGFSAQKSRSPIKTGAPCP